MIMGINITNVNIEIGDHCITMLSDLDDIVVKNCTLSGTSIDVRIKSWESQLK
ncbi:hypothetical protein MTR_7g072390 [Medicago truncatula]|uniref:Polygalacturonase n=1 Tax=Medicago truncatula TaxID=3880 RepID=G7KW38_MEDTR|nr:hypothetical protein MTR_7g072390 [Medicago truncatula]